VNARVRIDRIAGSVSESLNVAGPCRPHAEDLVEVGPEGSSRLWFIIGRTALSGLRDEARGDLAHLEAFFDVRADNLPSRAEQLHADVVVSPPHDARHVQAVIATLPIQLGVTRMLCVRRSVRASLITSRRVRHASSAALPEGANSSNLAPSRPAADF
jgi:hypothetical protein